MMKETKTVRKIIKLTGTDPDALTMDAAGPVPVLVETSSGKSRIVTGAYLAGGTLVLTTGK
jgi:hypothetical protein